MLTKLLLLTKKKLTQLLGNGPLTGQVPHPDDVEQREGSRVGGLRRHAVPRLRHGQQRGRLHRHEVHQGHRVRLRERGDGERGADGGPRLHFSRRV